MVVATRGRQAMEVADLGDVQREILPIPDRRQVGLTTYDAKDPDTSFPPITRLRPPAGAPNVLVVLIDDVGFGASSAFGGPVTMPTAERLAGRPGPEVHPVPHHRPVLADPGGAAVGPQPSRGRDGQHHRDGHLGAGLQRGASEYHGAAGRDAAAERVCHGAVRQVP
jgi:hypothetical protein